MKTCLNCGKEFTGGRHNRKFCDVKCSNEYNFEINYSLNIKKCKRCGEWKNISKDFYWHIKNKNIRDSICKDCAKKRHYEYVKKNRKKVLEYRRNRRKQNPEKFKEIDRKRRLKPERRIGENVSRGLRYRLKKGKNKPSFDILPYSKEELIEHLKTRLPENFMWEDFLKPGVLSLDHIIPQSMYSFNSYEDEEFLKCWDLRNLRLIPIAENLSKNNKFILKLIIEYEIQDLLPEGVYINERKST